MVKTASARDPHHFAVLLGFGDGDLSRPRR
ncbi:hypothetical protein ACLK1S_20000 [Escherichia coli]